MNFDGLPCAYSLSGAALARRIDKDGDKEVTRLVALGAIREADRGSVSLGHGVTAEYRNGRFRDFRAE